jgi:hypothetical protein
LSVLPSEIADATNVIVEECRAAGLGWMLVAQATGLATLKLEGGSTDALVHAALHLRSTFAPSSVEGTAPVPSHVKRRMPTGTLVVLHRPEGAGVRIETWGEAGDASPLMKRVKQQFDPKGILNPGRFVGGI